MAHVRFTEFRARTSQTDSRMVEKIKELIRNSKRTAFTGLGEPEPRKGDLTRFCSRRITGDERLVYRVAESGDDQRMAILQCRYHYQR